MWLLYKFCVYLKFDVLCLNLSDKGIYWFDLVFIVYLYIVYVGCS